MMRQTGTVRARLGRLPKTDANWTRRRRRLSRDCLSIQRATAVNDEGSTGGVADDRAAGCEEKNRWTNKPEKSCNDGGVRQLSKWK